MAETATSDWCPAAPPDLSAFSEIELDCETTGVDPYRGDRPVGFAVGTPAGRQYVPFAHKGGGNLDEATVRRWAERELRGKRIRNIYTQFDVNMFRAWGVDLAAQGCTFHDVSHSAALLDDHRRIFTLEALGQAELGVGKVALPFRPEEIANLPAGIVAPYACRDVDLVARLADVYRPRLVAEGLTGVAALEDAIIPVVCEMTWNGVPLDQELLSQWAHETGQLEEQLAWRIARACGFQVNPDGPADLKKLFAFCGVPITHFSATGAPSFTAEVMQEAAKTHALIGDVYGLGKLRDLRNKYFVKYQHDLCPDGKLHPTFNQLKTDDGGTVSGRFSSARPNIQQVMAKNKHERAYGPVWKAFGLPEDSYLVRKLFVPERGVWFCADQAQVEYRIATHYSQSPRLLQAYRDDPHTDYHAVVGEMLKAFRPDANRTEIKIINFLSIFGGGVGALERNGVADAAGFRDHYFHAFPEMRALLQRTKHVAETRGYVKTFDGRRARFPNGERSHKALNAIVQGTAASNNKMALVEAYTHRRELGLTMRITNHDELDGDLTEPMAPVMALLNEQRMALDVPVLWSGSTGANWAEAK